MSAESSGLAAVIHANGYRRELRFPTATPVKTIRAAADELRAQLRKLATPTFRGHIFS